MIFSLLGGCAAELGTQKVGEALLKGLGRTLNPSDLERYLAQGITTAKAAEPQLFFSYDKDGPKGFPKFLGKFFRGRALEQLQKPLKEQGKPDTELLIKALIQEAEDDATFKTLPQEKVATWMEAFVEAYFEKTNSALQFQLVREDYCEQILRVFDDVKFAGIAVEGQDIDRAERLAEIFVMPDLREEERRNSEVEKPFFQIGEGIKDRLSSQERQELLLREQQQEALQLKERKGGRVLPASDLFARGNTKHAVLLGAPGSGKTTLMNYFAVVGAAADSAIKADGEPASPAIGSMPDCLPIIIRIRDLARHPDLSILEFVRDFVTKDLAVTRDLSGFFEHYLETGKALILLDGLDEVADLTQRYKVVDKIEAFLNQCGECRTIITSRPAGYKRDFFRTDEFPHYELQPFDDDKIDTFIEHWYNSRFELESERERRKSSLRKALGSQARIKQLARNPLLLTIIALIHRYQAKLPKERFKLYDKAVETLLTTWDGNKELSNHEILKYLELDDLRRLMERLAYWIHCQGGTGDTEGGTLIDREELIAQLTQYIREMKKVERHEAKAEAKRFLELIVRDRAGLLSLQGQDRYAFVHKTFQEYLTAMEIRDRQEDGFEVVIEHVEEYLHDAHWEEVLLLLIAQQKRKNPAKILKCVLEHSSDYEKWLHRDLLFASTILTENVPLVENDLTISILDRLIKLEISPSPLVSKKLRSQIFFIIESLFETGFSDIAISILKQHEAAFKPPRFIDYLEVLAPCESTTALITFLQNDNWKVRLHGAASLARLDKDNDEVVQALISCLQDDNATVRSRTAASLEQLGKDNDEVVQALISCLQNDDDVDVRSRAAASLARLGKDNDDVIQALISCLQDDDDVDVRSRAAASLAQLGRGNDDVIQALISCLQDDNATVRSRTAVSLTRLKQDSDEVVQALISCLQDDDDVDVRFHAAESLAQLGNDNDIVVQALTSCLQDDNATIRFRAAESLG